MRLGLIGAFVLALLSSTSAALAAEPSDADSTPSNLANPPPGPADAATPNPADADAAKVCADVRIGNDRAAALNCLNNQMQRKVEHEQGTPQPIAPIDARSQSNEVGTANDAAAREKMGNAFGKSAVPQRPNPAFVSPLVPPVTH
jgi:hypothetical protein